MKVLILTKYGTLAASTRYRFLLYGPYFAEAGIDYVVSPLLGDDYLRVRLASGRRRGYTALRAIWRRLGALRQARRFDLVIVYFELFPYAPAFFEWLLAKLGVPYLCDFDDAIFHTYDLNPNPLIRRCLGKKIRKVIALSRGAIVGNEYLAAYARPSAATVTVIPTVVDPQSYPLKASVAVSSSAPLTIGWIGSPTTAVYLELVKDALAQFCGRHAARVLLVGSGAVDLGDIPVEIRPWSEATEVRDLQEMDVGIMPLPDSDWARGKCGFKLIQYMATGLPVVASPVGMNIKLVQPKIEGFLARTTDEWVAAFEWLLSHPEERGVMGKAGRLKVEREYSVQVQAPRLVALMQRTARGG